MQPKGRIFASAMAIVTMAGMALAPVAVRASEEGRRNTALGLGAVTAYLFTRRGNKIPAFAGLAATAYAYKRYDDSIKARHRRENYSRRRSSYRSGYRAGYRYARRHRR